ncbi:MAG: DUF2974 domain-containing protein [Oscillospiraceae bacterium]|nr:DUF2974 domain-containing protein [Oscillospiraceae bacterium]
MNTLVDYIKWLGRFSFEQYPLSTADNLVFAMISYFDLDEVFAQSEKPLLSNVLPLIDEGKVPVEITGADMGYTDILRAAASSRRFGSVEMSDYVNEIRTEPPLQFSAVTFRADSFSFIAYRGTDSTLAGWQEDFMISFTETEAQHMALDYAERLIIPGREWYITGHSKGGNLALYVAAHLSDDKLSAVKTIYCLDGPGFCPEVTDPEMLKRADGKLVRIVPEFDVVGKLFEPDISDTLIVKSNADGVIQHSMATWLFDGGELMCIDKRDAFSEWLGERLNDWIGTIKSEDRPVFINELFSTLTKSGAEKLEDLTPLRFEQAIVSLGGASEVTKKALASLPGQALNDGTVIEVNPGKIGQWLTECHFAHALLMVLFGILLLCTTDSILELTATFIFVALAAIQLILTLRRFVLNGFRIEGLRERAALTTLMLALCLVLIIKEQAMFIMGSTIFGIVFIAFAFGCADKASHESDRLIKVLYILETIFSAIFGGAVLIISRSVVYPFVLALGILMIADGVIRIGYMLYKRYKASRV